MKLERLLVPAHMSASSCGLRVSATKSRSSLFAMDDLILLSFIFIPNPLDGGFGGSPPSRARAFFSFSACARVI